MIILFSNFVGYGAWADGETSNFKRNMLYGAGGGLAAGLVIAPFTSKGRSIWMGALVGTGVGLITSLLVKNEDSNSNESAITLVSNSNGFVLLDEVNESYLLKSHLNSKEMGLERVELKVNLYSLKF